jgi:Ca2+/Na+ antiporter
MNAVLSNKRAEFELGLTCILGASIFQLSFGIAIGCLLIHKNYKLSFKYIMRDYLIYLAVLVLLYFYIQTEVIDFTKVIYYNLEFNITDSLGYLYCLYNC